MLGFPLLYCKGMRLMMFQLSGFYCKPYTEATEVLDASVHYMFSSSGPRAAGPSPTFLLQANPQPPRMCAWHGSCSHAGTYMSTGSC